MKANAYPVQVDGRMVGVTLGRDGMRYVHPTSRTPKPDPEPACRTPEEHAIHSRLDKVPADHPMRERWERDAHALTCALDAAECAEQEMDDAGFQPDEQPDAVEWDEDTRWIDDPWGLNRDDR